MNTHDDASRDHVIQMLITEAAADPDVIGLLLTGSCAMGAVTPESDYDVIFVVTDQAFATYQQTRPPPRGATTTPPMPAADIWHEAPSTLQLEKVLPWMLPAYAEERVLFDRTGETTHIIAHLRQIPAHQAQATVASWYDHYPNSLYRPLKAWRRGDELGGCMEAAQTADSVVHLLFALERRWRPNNSRLIFHLDELEGQGWARDEVQHFLLSLVSTGDPGQQRILAIAADFRAHVAALGVALPFDEMLLQP